MSELSAVTLAGDCPATKASLVGDLRALGISSGSVLLVHASLSAIGWVCGGEGAVVDALVETLAKNGTLVMATQSGDVSDPALWQNPPVPQSWWPIIREAMPAFDPVRTPTRGMGRIPENFRVLNGTIRSDHPTGSFAARGPASHEICRLQNLADPFGDRSPLSALYEMDASILLLGVGHESNTSLHLAERRAFGVDCRTVQTGAPVLIEGRRTWIAYVEPELYTDDFVELGAAFERDVHSVRIGSIGRAEARLIPQRAVVDYAVDWLRRHRAADGRPAAVPEKRQKETRA